MCRKLIASLFLLAALTTPLLATTLTGQVRDIQGNALTVNGNIWFTLSGNANVLSTGGCGGPYQVGPGTSAVFALTNGTIAGGAAVVGNDCMTPSTIFYRETVINSTGLVVLIRNVTITGASADIGTLPIATSGGGGGSGGVPTTRVIATQAPLAGGGDLSADRTLSVTTSPGGASAAVGTTRQVNTNGPLTGGGALSSDLTLSIPAATNSVAGYLSSSDHLQLVKTPRVFNVRDAYGAVCDGVTDDTTAIGNAWTAAAGATIYYPTGSCVDTATHSLAPGQKVFGDGPGKSFVLTRHATIQAFVIPAASYGAQVRDLTVQGNTPTNGFGGVKVQGTGAGTHAAVENVEVLNMTQDGVLVDGSWKDRLVNVYSHNNARDGFRIQKQTSPANNPAHVTCYECWSESNGGNGFTVTSADANPNLLGVNFVNCTSVQNTGNGYDLTNVSDAVFVGSYSAQETGGNGINANTVANLDVVGGGFHTLTNGIVLTSSTATIRSVYFVTDTIAIWVKTGTRGTSKGNYAPTAVTTYLKTDAGALYWSDDTPTNSLGGVTTRYTDTGLVLGPYGAKAYNSAAQSIATATATALTFNTDDHNQGAVHSTSVNTSRFTVPAGGAGEWLCVCQLDYAADTTGTYRDLYIYKNGSRIAYNRQKAPGTAILFGLNASTIARMADADYFECVAQHDGAGAINTTAGVDSTAGSAVRIGP